MSFFFLSYANAIHINFLLTNLEQLIMKKVIFIAAMVFALNFSSKANEGILDLNQKPPKECLLVNTLKYCCPNGSEITIATIGMFVECGTGKPIEGKEPTITYTGQTCAESIKIDNCNLRLHTLLEMEP